MNPYPAPGWPKKRYTYWQGLQHFVWVIAALWAVEIFDAHIYGKKLAAQGIHPGDWDHWEGIFMAPFLHADWKHLAANIPTLLILGAMVLVQGWRDLVVASISAILVGGLFVMVVGQPGENHIGSSIVFYGYFGFLISLGIYERKPVSILILIVVVVLYSGLIATMYPSDLAEQYNVSWEGHAGGALGGFFGAKKITLRK